MTFAKVFAVILAFMLVLTACGEKGQSVETVDILLQDTTVTADGVTVSTQSQGGVYIANDIVYYEEGKDFTYGEGSAEDAHSIEEAAAHTVLHITKAGTYRLSGTLSKGQVAIDLGEEAKENPEAVVTLILDGVDITCEVAPAIIFYNVYECDVAKTASKDVITTAAGANVIIADGSENTVNGAYVAKMYKPDSVVLNADGTEVEDAKKLHKYDGAFYSKMSMNVDGGKKGNGTLTIKAANEGLDSERHLTVNGGNIYIFSGNDGINTNEDGVSVTTVNGGVLNIQVTGETGEGDGIDSNGWLVINGGTVKTAACSESADAGIDSDMGIHINGGTVIAAGGMLDRIEDGGQTYAVFSFEQKQSGTDTVCLKNNSGKEVLEVTPQNDYSLFIYSSPDLKEGTYTLWSKGQQLGGTSGGNMGFGGGMRPDGEPPENMEKPEGFEGKEPPEGLEKPEGFEGKEPPEGFEGEQPPERPNGGQRPNGGFTPDGNGSDSFERITDFVIKKGGNMFNSIAPNI